MGQKSKNAGKKVSKTCDKKATAKSLHCKGCEVVLIRIPKPWHTERSDFSCYSIAKERCYQPSLAKKLRIDL